MVPVLGLVRPFAAVLLLAIVFGRALAPSAAGMGVGLHGASTALEWVGVRLSHLAAVLASVMLLGEVLVIMRSALGVGARIACVAMAGFVVLLAMTAIVARGRLPDGPIALGALFAASALVASAWSARQHPMLRPLPALFGAVGVAAIARVVAVALASFSARAAAWSTAARVFATAGFVLELGAVAVALGWLALRQRRVVSVATTVVLVLALVATQRLVATDPERVGPLGLLLSRGAEELLTRPEPFAPVALRIFLVVLGVLVAAALLLARGVVPAFAGAAALVVSIRSSAEMPLGAEALLVAAYALALVASDPRMLWSALPPAGAGGAAVGPGRSTPSLS